MIFTIRKGALARHAKKRNAAMDEWRKAGLDGRVIRAPDGSLTSYPSREAADAAVFRGGSVVNPIYFRVR